MVEALLTGVFTQTKGTNHTHPHATLGIHILGCLTSRHRDGVQPLCHAQTCLAVVFQHQLLLHFPGCIRTLVKRPQHVGVELSGMGDKRLWLNELHIAGLLVPKVTEHVGRSLQQLCRLFCLILSHQQLDDQHGGLLHRDIGIFRQRELTEQLFQ